MIDKAPGRSWRLVVFFGSKNVQKCQTKRCCSKENLLLNQDVEEKCEAMKNFMFVLVTIDVIFFAPYPNPIGFFATTSPAKPNSARPGATRGVCRSVTSSRNARSSWAVRCSAVGEF